MYRIFIKIRIISSHSVDNLCVLLTIYVTDEISHVNEGNSRNRSATDSRDFFVIYIYIYTVLLHFIFPF